MAAYDAVFVGAGINSLASAALLSQAGWTVCVLERNDYLGGCIKTSSELTAPGFTHEVMASWHPLFTGSPAYAELEGELSRRGVEYLNTELPTGTAFPDGRSAFLSTSLEDNMAELERHGAGDGAAWQAMFEAFMANADLSFGVLGTELWSPAGLGLGRQALRRFGRRGCSPTRGTLLSSCRDWLEETFRSDAAHGLLAPWVLHTGLGPDQATSGFMTQVIACALQLGGMPVPKGGGVKLVDGLAGIVRDAGGELRTGADGRAGARLGRPCDRRSALGRRDDPRAARRRRERDPHAALRRSPCERRRIAGRRGRRGQVPLRARRDADPLRARRAPRLAGRRTTRANGDRPRDTRARRRVPCGERGRARAAPRGGDGRVRAAPDGRSLARARRLVGSSGSSSRSFRRAT